MKTTYNLIAGQSMERLAALSDGIFAVAMTLLVLDLRSPVRDSVHSEADLWRALGTLGPQLITYLMSFLTLGIFWNGQQAQLSRFSRGDRNVTWIHIAFLFAVTLMPFSTRLLAESIQYRTALVCYWANVLLLGVALYCSWRCALKAKLLKEDTTADAGRAIERRILIAQALYALGAALCVISTYASIGFIVLVQVNFAVAPRVRLLSGF